jgi:hypothetical protein
VWQLLRVEQNSKWRPLPWSFLCFSFVKHFGRFQGNGSHFEITWHMIFLQGFIKFDQVISEKSVGQKCVEE